MGCVPRKQLVPAHITHILGKRYRKSVKEDNAQVARDGESEEASFGVHSELRNKNKNSGKPFTPSGSANQNELEDLTSSKSSRFSKKSTKAIVVKINEDEEKKIDFVHKQGDGSPRPLLNKIYAETLSNLFSEQLNEPNDSSLPMLPDELKIASAPPLFPEPKTSFLPVKEPTNQINEQEETDTSYGVEKSRRRKPNHAGKCDILNQSDFPLQLGDRASGICGSKQLWVDKENKKVPISYCAVSVPGIDKDNVRGEGQCVFEICEDFFEDEKHFVAVMLDGHGDHGRACAEFAKEELLVALQEDGIDKVVEGTGGEKNDDPSVALAFHKICHKVSDALCKYEDIDTYLSGTTMICCYLSNNVIYTVNVGDCRAMIGRRIVDGNKHRIQAFSVSADHKPEIAAEKDRIVASGGRVFEWGVLRVWKRSYDFPGLSMTRSLGDQCGKEIGVLASPDVGRSDTDENDLFLVMASNGILSLLKTEEIVEAVSEVYYECEGLSAMSEEQRGQEFSKRAVKRVLMLTLHKWRRIDHTAADCTIIVLKLN